MFVRPLLTSQSTPASTGTPPLGPESYCAQVQASCRTWFIQSLRLFLASGHFLACFSSHWHLGFREEVWEE